MKRFIRIISPLIFLAFAACGGGDKGGGAPPQPADSPLTKEGIDTLNDTIANIDKLKSGACGQQGTEVMLILIASRQGGGAGGPPPLPPPNPDCDDLIFNNIILPLQTVMKQNGQSYMNDLAPKLWLAQQIGAFLNHIRDKVAPVAIAAGINPDQLLMVFANELKPYFQSMLSRVGSRSPQVAQQAAPYLNGL